MRAPAEISKASTVPCEESLLFLHEGGYVLKTLTDPEERIQAYRLRHAVFCEKLGWTPKKKWEWKRTIMTGTPFRSASSTSGGA